MFSKRCFRLKKKRCLTFAITLFCLVSVPCYSGASEKQNVAVDIDGNIGQKAETQSGCHFEQWHDSQSMPLGSSLYLCVNRHLSEHNREQLVIVDVVKQKIVRKFSLLVEREGYSATMMPNGRVLIFGGYDKNKKLVETSEWFDPATGTSDFADNFGLTSRAFHSATVLVDGRLVVSGGESELEHPLTSVEILNFKKNILYPALQLTSGRSHHVEVLQNSGYPAWMGGDLAGAEQYDPHKHQILPIQSIPAVNHNERFQVVQSYPEQSGILANTRESIGVQLSQRLSAENDFQEQISFVGPRGHIDFKVHLAQHGQLLFIEPTQELIPSSYYVLTISDTVSVSGQKLPLTTLGFRTSEIDVASLRQANSLLPEPVENQPKAKIVILTDDLRKSAPKDRFAWSKMQLPQSTEADSWIPKAENLYGKWHHDKPHIPDRQSLMAADGITALSGHILKLNGTPLKGVKLTVGDVTVESDKNGQFLLQNLDSNMKVLSIDGQSLGRKQNYGRYDMHIDLVAHKTTAVEHTIWLTKLDPQGTVRIPSPTVEDTVVSTPSIPGLELHLPKGTVIRDAQGNIVREINITAIPTNQPPFPVPQLQVPTYFTIQPGGAQIQGLTTDFRGAQLYYPNYRREAPGARGIFWNYDAKVRRWYTYGLGTVESSGQEVIPDPGVAIYELTGAMFDGAFAPPPNAGAASSSPLLEPTFSSDAGASPCGEGDPDDAGAGCPGSGSAGDPVLLYSGQFARYAIDLVLPDMTPLAVRRTYNSNDLNLRPFGVGMGLEYETFFYSENQYTEVDLVRPDGTRVHFTRTSPGVGYADAVFSTSAAGIWFGASISYTHEYPLNSTGGWKLLFRDGTSWFFREYKPVAYIVDKNGNRTHIVRDDSDRVVEIDSPNGHWIRFVWSISGTISQAIDDTGRAVSYGYDATKRLTSVTDPNGGVVSYTYDANNRMTAVTNADGNNVITNTYNSNNRIVKQTLADGSQLAFSYQFDGSKLRKVDVTDRAGIHRLVTFNDQGYITQSIYGSGLATSQNTTFNVDANGRVQSMVDALGRMTSYSFDNLGNTNAVTFLAGTPNAVTRSWIYEKRHSFPTQYTDPNGAIYQYAYDSYGNLTQMTDPLGRQTKWAYDTQGRPVQLTNALGQVVSLTYQGAHLQKITDANALVTKLYYDNQEHVIGQSSPQGHLTSYVYDARDHVVKTTDALGNAIAMSYDHSGNLLSYTDPRGKITRYTYDKIGRLTSTADPLARSSYRTYDSNGRLAKLTNRKGNVRGISYDTLGRISSVGFGASPNTPTAYSQSIKYTWDIANRVTGLQDDSNISISQTYDGFDRIISQTYPTGTVTYTYDRAGRILTRTASGQSVAKFAYDAVGNLTSLSQNNNTLTFAYDALNRRTSMTLVNGVKGNYTYDVSGRLTSISYSLNSNTLGNLNYSYDADSRIIGISGSLAKMLMPTPFTAATYDDAGQMISVDNQSFTYDKSGALLSGNGATYTWDSREHLSSLHTSNANATFIYLPNGQRLKKTVNGKTTSYLYSEDNFIQEQDGNGTVTANILTGLDIDETFTRTTASGMESYLTDGLNSTLALLGNTGIIDGRYTYSPYGEVSLDGNAMGNSQTYTGREDDGTGLLYYRARFYDPKIGRFIQQDPLGFGAGTNVYAYVSGNPIAALDPWGLSTITYNNITHEIVIYNGQGIVINHFPATNKPAPGDRPFPAGIHGFDYHKFHGNEVDAKGILKDSPNGAFGIYGNYVFKVKGRDGMGIHAGRANKGGPEAKTNGCIRSSEEALKYITDLVKTDPLTELKVVR